MFFEPSQRKHWCQDVIPSCINTWDQINEIPQTPSSSQKVIDCWKTEIYSFLEMNQKADHHSVASTWFSRALYKKYKVQKWPQKGSGHSGLFFPLPGISQYRQHLWTSDCVTEEHTRMTKQWLLKSSQPQALRDPLSKYR